MGDSDGTERMDGRGVGPAPLFILSPDDRDGLSALATKAGWRPVAVRHDEEAERRFLNSGAQVAVVDARRDAAWGAEMVEALREAVELSGSALLLIAQAENGDPVGSRKFSGATHFLVDGFDSEAKFALALESCWRLVERLAGGRIARGVAAAAVSGTAPRDPLTGLGTRASAVEWIDARTGQDGAVVVLLSISQFERVNSIYGQAAGDALLTNIARRIERALEEDGYRDGAFAARIAGTEYLVALAEQDAGRASVLAARLLAIVGRPYSADGRMIHLSGRCGIAEAQAGEDAQALLRRAGAALAEARRADGPSIRMSQSDTPSRPAAQESLERDLRFALDRGEIDVLFQPQYAMADDVMVGVEALARWNHGRYGQIGAGSLFAAAERSDFIVPLSEHIQARALRSAAQWPDSLSHIRLSVNVTAADISQPDFLERFTRRVADSGFPPERLTVEITESGLIHDLPAAAALLEQLRRGGMRVAIDDFGTGYSSLAYLKALPLDYLKLDSGLAQDITGSERDQVVVRGVIGMARSLKLSVIAEGVETAAQRALLAHEGCDVYQGFLRSRAVSSAALAQAVEQG